MTISARGKRPAAKWKPYQTARASESVVRGWFAKPDATGIGVIFGAVSGGLASRDFDDEGAYRRWAEEHAKLAMALPTVKTHRGYHLYFRAAEEHYADCGDGEYRGNTGHLSVLPPSLHPKGVRYEWTQALPPGDLPLIDPVDEGLLSERDGECNREHRDDSVVSVDSADSVDSVLSVDSVAWTDALNCTLPAEPGQRNAMIFRLARLLKARPEAAHATAKHFEPLLREWHKRALPIIGTKSFDDTRLDFARAWDVVKFPMGRGPVEGIMERAKTMTVPEAGRYESFGIRQLATLCALLQNNAGDGVFFLSSRKAANVLGESDHTTTWRWLDLLRRDGLLVLHERGKHTRASRWRWMGSEACDKPGADATGAQGQSSRKMAKAGQETPEASV